MDSGLRGHRPAGSLARVRRNAAALGHPVVIFAEVNSVIEGVADFNQKGFLIPSAAEPDFGQGSEPNADFGNNVPGVYARRDSRCRICAR
jgi:hypothetical protein